MAPNPRNGYGPPAGHPNEANDSPKRNGSSSDLSSIHLLTEPNGATASTSPNNRSPHDVFSGAKARLSGDSGRPSSLSAPSPSAESSDINSLLREVESDLSTSTNTKTARAARYKAARVRFSSKEPEAKSPPKMDHGSPVSPLLRTYNPSAPSSYQPSSYVPSEPSSPISRHGSVMDNAPYMSPGNIETPGYRPFRPSSRASRSPTRASSPLRGPPPEYSRPPSTLPFEPADINGAPRPGTPSTMYGGSPKRPLPPAPLFSGTRSSFDLGDEKDMTAISMGDPEDPFGPESEETEYLNDRSSFVSESTLAGDEYDEKDPDLYATLPSGRQERRGARLAQTAKKEVKLTNGELILECKIPTILHSFLPRRDDVEFTHMRYTAVTCDPDEYVERGYKLRQNMGQMGRETELFICVTMYNENEIDFTRTMHGVMRNIAHFCSRTKSRTWGKDGWQKIVVCVISDGREKVHPRTLDALAAMGCYQSGIAKNVVNQNEVTAHVYEYTTQVSLDADLRFKGAEKGIVPCQMIFCLKEKNAKKLNSHRWFFNAFGRALNPNICILLDVGTRPGDDSLYHLWKAFDRDSTVAGAAGEIKAAKGKGWLQLLNPLVASQNFEYKMSNILDKPLESVFGYITVLPGALSAYRYHALQNDETGHGPLSQYFKGETLHGQEADVFTANMYLAEDRILCWELVAKRNERWVLKYVKAATGETDVPDAVPEFISQRRRWLNGAFFAAVYSLLHFKQVWQTDHTIARKILLHVEFVYQLINLLFTFFSLGNFYLTFYFIAGSLADPKTDPFGHGIGKFIFIVLRYACILLIMMQFVLSMGNRPQGAKKMFLGSMITFGIIMVYNTFAALYIVVMELQKHTVGVHNTIFMNMIVSCLSTVGLYFLMSFLYMDPWHMFTSSAQYFALLPSYVCTLQVYAFCNAHDVTWGTKGDNVIRKDLGVAKTGKNGLVELEMPSEQLDIDSGYDEALRNLRDRVEVPTAAISESQQQEDYYRAVRTYVVIVWMACNAVLAMAVSEAYGNTHVAHNTYLSFILWSVALVALFRAVGSSTFLCINVVQWIAEYKLKLETKERSKKHLGGGRTLEGGWTNKISMPKFSSPANWFNKKQG